MANKNRLALLGGAPICSNEFPILKADYTSKEERAALRALRNGMTIFSNDVVREFERRFARSLGFDYAISVSSGTMAMTIALRALKRIMSGISRVFIPAYSYIALANSALMSETKYEIVDNDPISLSLSAEKLIEAGKIDDRSVVILPYVFGVFPDSLTVSKLLRNPELNLIEDCALGIGTRHGGKKSGTFGIGCFSFAEPKTISTAGEGGMIATKTERVARLCRAISHQGLVWEGTELSYIDSSRKPTFYELQNKFDCYFEGYTARMSAVQAATGIVQLERLNQINNARWKNAKYLAEYLSAYREYLKVPVSFNDSDPYFPSNHLPVILSDDFHTSRDVLLECLRMEGVPASIYSPRPLFEYTLVRKTCSNSTNAKDYPVARKIAKQHFLLPVYRGLKRGDISAISSSIEKVISCLSNRETRLAAEKTVRVMQSVFPIRS